MKKNEVYTVVTALKSVTFHLEITVLGAEMDLGRKHHLYIGLFGCQNFRLCHCCGSQLLLFLGFQYFAVAARLMQEGEKQAKRKIYRGAQETLGL